MYFSCQILVFLESTFQPATSRPTEVTGIRNCFEQILPKYTVIYVKRQVKSCSLECQYNRDNKFIYYFLKQIKPF